jgi:hypothetical protein
MSMWPKHFVEGGDLTSKLSLREWQEAMMKDIKIVGDGKKWKVLSYYYLEKDKCFALDIEELNSTYEEGWNAVLKNLVEEGKNKRSDGNRAYKEGWDACMKAKNPDWL